MVRFVDDVFVSDNIAPKVSKIKWKTACGIGMTGIYFIALSETASDLFDIYSASMFKQRGLRRSNIVIIGIADSYSGAIELTSNMIQKCMDEAGELVNVRKYYEDYIDKHL